MMKAGSTESSNSRAKLRSRSAHMCTASLHERTTSRVRGRAPLVGPPVESPSEEAPARRGEAGEQHLAHELVAKAEANSGDAKDAVLAEPLKLLDELGRVVPSEQGG